MNTYTEKDKILDLYAKIGFLEKQIQEYEELCSEWKMLYKNMELIKNEYKVLALEAYTKLNECDN